MNGLKLAWYFGALAAQVALAAVLVADCSLRRQLQQPAPVCRCVCVEAEP